MSASFTSYVLDYLYCFGMDPVPTTFQPAFFDLWTVNIINQSMVYVASIRADLDSL
jgi:hypothetical protein